MDRQVVHNWLRSVLVPYANPDRTFADVVSLLEAFPSLSPRTDLYISNVGQSLLLLQLKGTIPMQFRGQTYNVPIEVWVNKAYPREPPIGYVSPTKDMLVRKTEEVDLDGLINGTYQKEWTRKWESKSLLAFIHACQDIFSRQPPVYAKPPTTSTSATPSQAAAATASPASPRQPQPLPSQREYPGSASGSSHHKPPPPLPGQGQPSAHSGPSSGPPQKPPKPGQSQYGDGPSRSSSGSWGPATHNGAFHPTHPPSHAHYQQGPPRSGSIDGRHEVNGHPAYSSPQLESYGSHAGFRASQGPGPGSAGPMQAHPPGGQRGQAQHGPTQSPVAQQQMWNHNVHHPEAGSRRLSTQHPPGQYGHPANQHSSTPPPALPPSAAPQSQYQPNSATHPAPSRGPPLPTGRPITAQEDFLDSLAHDSESSQSERAPDGATQNISSSSGPPPPRPLNPELAALHHALHAKLSSRVEQLRSTLGASNTHLSLLVRDLDAGPPAIEDEEARLRAVLSVCQSRSSALESALERLRERTRELQTREQPRSVEVVLADSIAGDQLVGLVAQDLAITDTLYHLSRALGNEEIELERYLKWVRQFGREQFLKRALAMKISRGLEAS